MSATIPVELIDNRTMASMFAMDCECFPTWTTSGAPVWRVCDYHEGYGNALETHTTPNEIAKRPTVSHDEKPR